MHVCMCVVCAFTCENINISSSCCFIFCLIDLSSLAASILLTSFFILSRPKCYIQCRSCMCVCYMCVFVFISLGLYLYACRNAWLHVCMFYVCFCICVYHIVFENLLNAYFRLAIQRRSKCDSLREIRNHVCMCPCIYVYILRICLCGYTV